MRNALIGGMLGVVFALSVLPALAEQTATEYQNSQGGKAVVGPNGHGAVKTANGNKAYVGPHSAGYNSKSSSGYVSHNGSGSYNKTSGQYHVNTANKKCAGTTNAQGVCVTK
jgi:hypothetical protein